MHDSRLTHETGHRFMAGQAQTYPKEVYRTLVGDGGAKWLDRIWAGLKRPSGAPIPRGVVKYRPIESEYGLEGFIITFPEPKAPPEAFFSAVIFQRGRDTGSEAIASARYFTLELGHKLQPADDPRLYFLCEWTKDSHLNYGSLPSYEEREFLSAVRRVTMGLSDAK